MFKFGDSVGRKPGEGLRSESVQGTIQGPGGKGGIEAARNTGVVAAGGSGLGPGGSPVLANVSQGMMGSEGGRLSVGGAFGVAGPRVFGGLATPQAMLQNHHNPFDIAAGGGGTGAGGGIGTGGILPGAIADSGAQWGSVGGVQDQQLQQQLLMLQRFQAQQQHLQQQQQQPLQGASQQQLRQHSIQPSQQLIAAALPVGAVPPASPSHAQMGFILPAQMRVQMATRMAQLGSAALDGGANGAPRRNSVGNAGGTVGLPVGAPGELAAANPDTPPNFTVETPRQQDLQVHAQCQQIQQHLQLQQQQQQQQYQQQSTSITQGRRAEIGQKESDMKVVNASSPTLGYSPSGWKTGDMKLGAQSMDTASLNASRNGNANSSAPKAVSSQTGRDNGIRRSNGGSDGDSVNVRREGVSEAGTKADTRGSGGSRVGDSGGGGVNNGVGTFPSGLQAGMSQMSSNVDRGSVAGGGAGGSGNGSGTLTADNTLGMAAAVMSFYNELPGSTGGGVNASMTRVAQNTPAGAGAPGSGSEGEQPGQGGGHESGGGSKGTGASDGTDWQQVVKPGLTSYISGTVSPGNQVGVLDPQPQQAKDGFGRQDKRVSSGTANSGWALGAPIDGTGLVAAAVAGTVGVGAGGGTGSGVGAMQPAAAGTAGTVGIDVGKQQQAYLQAMFQARMQQQQQLQQHLQQQQFARTPQQSQLMQAQHLATHIQQQFRLQSQQMNALFQAKQMALQQKLRAGQMTLQQAQQVSQMQQVQLARAIQTLYVQAQAQQQQQAAQIFAQQQVQQLQLHNIQQLQMMKFQQQQQQQQQQQARALQLPAMGAPQALQPLVGGQPENQAPQRTADAVSAPPSPSAISLAAETSGVGGRGNETVSSIPQVSSGPPTVAAGGGGGDVGSASNTQQAQRASVVPEASAVAGGPSVVGGGVNSDVIEAGVRPDTLKSNPNVSTPAAAASADLSSGTQAPHLSSQLPQQTTLIQNFEASAAASRVAAAAASKAVAGGTGASRDAIWSAGGGGIGGSGGGPMGVNVTALQQQMIMQQQQQQMAAVMAQQQLVRQNQVAGGVAPLFPDNQQQLQQQQQQQQLMMVSNFPGGFAHAGVNPAQSTPSGGGGSGGLNIAGQSLWPAGLGLGAGVAGPPRPPPPTAAAAAAGTVATSLPFQQRQPTGFSASTSTPTTVFPSLGVPGGVGMLGAVMGGGLGLMGSNPGNNLERQQQVAATAFNLEGINRIVGAVTDNQQQAQPQILPQDVQPLQQQNSANFGREAEKASMGLASSVDVPSANFVSTSVSAAASETSDASATATAGVPGAAATDATGVTSASGPTPRPWNGPVDDEDWGPEGEEEFMSMLNLAMDDEDAEMGQTKGAMAPTLGFSGWDEEEDPHPDEAQDDYDDELSAYKEDPKIALGHGSRVRRKQFVEKLEKAKVEMAADLKARGKEDQLALKLREQWHQKMRDIALAILRRWWSAGDMKKSCSTNGGGKIRGGGGEGSDSGGEKSWQDLLTDDAVAVAPVESGRVEISVCRNVTSGGTVGSAATTQGVKQGSVVVPSARARAKEARLEGLAAVRAEAERLRVMTETLGYPTPLGNLKLKFDVHVDHWAFGERELMCQWRASTRNAALCGGRWELETRGMMSLYMWTSEDGEAPSVEPKSKASTWAILRSPADRTESPYSQPSLQQQSSPPTQPSQKSTSSLAPPLSDARRETKAGLAVGASPVVAPISTVASTWVTATGTGARRTKVFQGASGVKRSRQDMEAGTAMGITGEASSVAGESKRACNTGSRGGVGGGENSFDSNGGRTGDARAVEAAVKPEEEFPWLNDPRGEGMGAGATAKATMDMVSTTGYTGVDNHAAAMAEKRVSRKVGSDRSNSPVALMTGSDSSPNGGCRLWCGRWKPRRLRRDQDGRELGKVVGVPRQAKARDVYILYDHCGFVGELEESFGREIPPVPRTLEQAELPRVRRRLRFPASAFSWQPKVGLDGKKSNGVRAEGSREGAAENGAAGAADHLDDKGRNASGVPAPNGCGAATEVNPVKDKRHKEEGSDSGEELPCALTSFGEDGVFRVLRTNHALRSITRRRRRRSGGSDGGGGEGGDSLVAEADEVGPNDKNSWNENGDGREEEGGGGLGSPPRLSELGKVVCLWKQPGRRKEVRTVEFAVSVDDGGGEERHAPAATASSAIGTVAGGARRGGLVGSSSACRGGDEAQHEHFRKVSEALRQGLPLWLPVGIVAVDGSEIQGYAAVYPLTSSLAEAEDVGLSSRTEAEAEMVYGMRETGDGGISRDTPLQYALWEFHCVEGSVHLCVSRVVDKLMAALFRKMGDVMLEPAYEESLSLMQLNKLVDPEQWGDVEVPLGQGDAREDDGRSDGGDVASGDRRRALLRLKQLWTLYQVCSQKELQLTSSFSLFHKMRRSPSLDNRRDSRTARSRGEGGGKFGGGVKGGIPGRIGVSKGIVGISRNIEEETVRFFMSSVRQFLLETRRGVVMDLLFHILKGCENDPDLGRIVEELVWSSWAVHRDEEVVRLMAEATKLSNAGKFDRSNASLDKVLKIDENHAEAYNRRATNLMLKGRMQEAAVDIQKVLAIEPRHFGALRGFGVLRMKLKDYSGALVAFELAVKINPMMLPGLRDNVAVCQAAGNAMLS